MQKTPRVCRVSLKHNSSGARNFPCLNIKISSSAGEELPKGNVTFPAMLACLEWVFVARVPVPVVLCCRKRCFVLQTEIKPLPWLGVRREVRSRAGSETGSWPRSEQESKHPKCLPGSVSVGTAEPRCFQLTFTPAGCPQEERSPFHKVCWAQPRPPQAVGRDVGLCKRNDSAL